MNVGFARKNIVIVIAILAVIAAFFMPIQHIPKIALRASCQCNLKQLGLAYIQYTQDFDGKFPPGVNAAGNGWAGQLYPYIKADGIYKCPSDKRQGQYISYTENANIVGRKLKTLNSPSATVELYELSTPDCDPSSVSPLETNSATGINAPQTSKRHDPSWFSSTYALNFLLADGHIKYLPPGKISNGANAVHPKNVTSGPYVLTFEVK